MTPGEVTSTAICVLGMSRSGTSLTARILSLAGVYLGPEEKLLQKELHQLRGEGRSVVAKAQEANPGGFWEHYELMRLNERILRRLGGSWRDPPDPQPGWEASAELALEREEARALLEATFTGHERWGWKDPRNSLTLPLWKDLIPNLRYVICLRNPLDVAKSLERRDGLSVERGITLWQTYLSRAIEHTSGGPRIFIPYERYFEDSHEIATDLAHFAGRPDAFVTAAARGELVEAIDGRLWRQRAGASAGQSIRNDRVPQDAVSLYETALGLASFS